MNIVQVELLNQQVTYLLMEHCQLQGNTAVGYIDSNILFSGTGLKAELKVQKYLLPVQKERLK